MSDDLDGREVSFSRSSGLENAIGISADDQRLREWIARDPSRAPLLEGKIVGTISWSRELGASRGLPSERQAGRSHLWELKAARTAVLILPGRCRNRRPDIDEPNERN
jgi:hypothetical protein